jgi:hypothetical protein
MKKWILLLTLMGSATAGEYWKLNCTGYGQGNTLEISGEIEESGSTYLDGYLDITLKEAGAVVFQKTSVDTTGFFQLASVDGKQVYIAQLRPMNRSEFTFLSVAANHPWPSGNSKLIWNEKEYLAECTVR